MRKQGGGPGSRQTHPMLGGGCAVDARRTQPLHGLCLYDVRVCACACERGAFVGRRDKHAARSTCNESTSTGVGGLRTSSTSYSAAGRCRRRRTVLPAAPRMRPWMQPIPWPCMGSSSTVTRRSPTAMRPLAAAGMSGARTVTTGRWCASWSSARVMPTPACEPRRVSVEDNGSGFGVAPPPSSQITGRSIRVGPGQRRRQRANTRIARIEPFRNTAFLPSSGTKLASAARPGRRAPRPGRGPPRTPRPCPAAAGGPWSRARRRRCRARCPGCGPRSARCRRRGGGRRRRSGRRRRPACLG